MSCGCDLAHVVDMEGFPKGECPIMNQSRKPIMTGVDNVKFVELFIKNNVEFMLVGGAAVLHYGCRADGVSEIDLMIEPEPANSDRVMRALTQAGVTPSFTSKDLQRPKVQLPIKRNDYYLDILTPWNEISYADLRERSELGMIGRTEVRVVSRDDLIKLKEFVVQHLESEAGKHRKDLQCLTAV